MVMYWEYLQDKPHLVGQLSRNALQGIARGVNETLLAERAAGGPQVSSCQRLHFMGQSRSSQ